MQATNLESFQVVVAALHASLAFRVLQLMYSNVITRGEEEGKAFNNNKHHGPNLYHISSPQGAPAKLGLLANLKDTIPGPVDSIGTPKMYILGKRISRNQIWTLDFFD